jgi:hypothetical protein
VARRDLAAVVEQEHHDLTLQCHERLGLRRVEVTMWGGIGPARERVQEAMGVIGGPAVKVVIGAQARAALRASDRGLEQARVDELDWVHLGTFSARMGGLRF